MSGDVQPRKRKDKKKKKDDLGIEEPRGTAAALGDGDVFMHSHHEHGTGGHWCAKVIFFSLLAVLVTLIGLIILENRGLSELEANSVESRYSGVLEGWLEEGHDDDHHDEHTLELNHHDDEDDDDDNSAGVDHDNDQDESHEDDHDDENDDDDEEQSDEDGNEERNLDDDNERNQDDDDEENQDDDDDDDDDDESLERNDDDQDEADSQQADDDDNNSEEQNLDTADDEDEVKEPSYRRYYRSIENRANDDDDDDDDDDEQKLNDQSTENDDDDNQQNEADNDSQENDDDDDQEDETKNDSQENDDDDDEQNQLDTNEENDDENSKENDQDEDDEDHDDHNDHTEDESDVELEHIEEEVFDDEASTETRARQSEDSDEVSKEAAPVADADEDEVELLEPDELDDLPDELPIPVPKGRPLVEVEDTTSTEKPQDTLAEEEEYERQQEALRKEKEQASQGMWLKVVVGGALLVATQAVLRRATAPRDEDEVDTTREETPLSDRRMTLINEPVPPPEPPKPQEVSRPVVQKEVVKQAPVVKTAPPPPPDEEDDEEEIIVAKDIKQVAAEKDTINKEFYSDEEEEVEEEEEEIEEQEPTPKPVSKLISTTTKESQKSKETKPIEIKEPPKVEREPTPEDDDVEIIEEEDIGDDLEEEEDDISDVDDAELLTRLEAKYGRLPEPDRLIRKNEGGNSIEDEWPGEPSDAYWRDELDRAERDLRQGEWTAAAERASAAELRASARARYVVARALDAAAEAKRDNGLLTKAIAAYLELLKMNEKLSDKKLIEATDRAVDRMKFRGNYLGTEPVYRLLIRRFPDDPIHRNNLTVSFLMANRVDLAEEVIKETLKRWPNDRLALAHHGFILKTLHNKLEDAVDAFTKALKGDTGPANEPRFYYHLGDALLLLGRFEEAHEVHKRGAKLGHFLSPAQRSLYNVERLKSQPWWDVEKTPYVRLARALEKSWKEILKEGLAAQALFEKEKEGLKERGDWSQLDLFVRGREVPNRCSRAPVTCGIVRAEPAASGCRRGQVKFSAMQPGTHVRPHVGPTNCRLRMHLGLSNTKHTFLRVDQETRQWQTGKVLMFDDSFEHEVWHNGSGARLVLIVDVWHPALAPPERARLPAI